MKNSELLSSTKHIGKVSFLFITLILIFAYSVALIEKINRPNFKNLPLNEFIILGILLVILIFINLKWVFRFHQKKSNGKK